MSNEKKIYYGEIKCEKNNCQNKANFSYLSKYFCGVHSKKLANKQNLPRRDRNESLKLKQEERLKQTEEIEEARVLNQSLNKLGNVIVCKMKMMKSPDYIKGYLNVFPNFKHQFRTDGFGCSSLSPMNLGPVCFFNKEVSKNLENFHQGSKCFEHETNVKSGEPSELFFKNQLNFFNDNQPHRHKFKSKPKYFVWKDENNKIHKLNYIESRQFYCNFYERLAVETADFKKLKSLINNGTNIQICGYDGRKVDKDRIEAEYLDGTKPFGHELVLFHMLTCDSANYVWKKYKNFNF